MNAVIKENLNTQDLTKDVEELVKEYRGNPSDRLLSAIYYKIQPDIMFAKSIYAKYARLDDFESFTLYTTYDCCRKWNPEKKVKFKTYLISAIKNEVKNFYRDMNVDMRKGSIYTKSLYEPVGEDDTMELIDLIPDKNDYIFDKMEILSMFEGKERELVQIILEERNSTMDLKYVYKKLNCTDSKLTTLKKHIRQILLADPYFKKLLQY